MPFIGETPHSCVGCGVFWAKGNPPPTSRSEGGTPSPCSRSSLLDPGHSRASRASSLLQTGPSAVVFALSEQHYGPTRLKARPCACRAEFIRPLIWEAEQFGPTVCRSLRRNAAFLCRVVAFSGLRETRRLVGARGTPSLCSRSSLLDPGHSSASRASSLLQTEQSAVVFALSEQHYGPTRLKARPCA